MLDETTNPYRSPKEAEPNADDHTIPEECEVCGKPFGFLHLNRPKLQKKAIVFLLVGGFITTIWMAVVYTALPEGTPLVVMIIPVIVSPGTPVGLMAAWFRRVRKFRCFYCGHRQQVLVQ